MSPKAAAQESASPLGCRPIAQGRPPRQHAYDAAGRTSWVEDQRGYVTTTVYDAAGRAQARIDQQSNRTTFVYDAAGQQIAVADALNNRTTQDYYDTGWLKDRVDPLGNRTTYSYDSLGNRLTATDALGRVTTSAYDARGLNSSTTDARGYTTTFIYDALSRQSAVQDARGNLATSVYDAAGRLSAHVDQLTNRTSFAYDAAGRRISRLDAKGQIASYSYDDDGRQTGIQYSDGALVTFSYDAAGRRTQMQDSTGITTYAYDELSRLNAVTYPANKTLTYSYDPAGNRAALIDPDGGITTYSYDSRNQLGWLLNPFSERTTRLYDALLRVTTITHANGAVAEQDYDAGGRITAVRNLKSDRSVISIFTYSYDAVANRTSVQEANGDLVTWSYHEIYQLTREQRSGANAYDITYTYDPVGNRLTKLEGGVTTTYSYDAADELTTSEDSGGVTTFTYDANGNTVGELRPNGDRVTYTWDIENHVTKVELPASVVNTFTLGGDGKRRRIEDSDGLRNIIWDAENILAETDNANAMVAQYTLAPEEYGQLVSQRRSGATSFHHFDALGSTNRLTAANAATLAEYLYRAFGEQAILSGTSLNRFTWAGIHGYYREPDPGQFWVRARVVSSGAARWLSPVDSLSFGNAGHLGSEAPREHPYAYAGNNPVNAVDPSGLFFRQSGYLSISRSGGSLNVHVTMLYSIAKGVMPMDMGRVQSLFQDDAASIWSSKYSVCIVALSPHLRCGQCLTIVVRVSWWPYEWPPDVKKYGQFPFVVVFRPGVGRWNWQDFYVKGHLKPGVLVHIAGHELGHHLGYLVDEYGGPGAGQNKFNPATDKPYEPDSIMGWACEIENVQSRTYPRHYSYILDRWNWQELPWGAYPKWKLEEGALGF